MNWNKFADIHEDLTDETLTKTESVPIFAPIVSDGFTRLANLPQGTIIPTGSTLIYQSKRCTHVTLLLDGLVKLVSVSGDGKQVTLGLRTTGWYAGACSVLMDTDSVYSVVAITPCKVVQIPAADFYQRLIQNARMMRHFVSMISSEMISMSSAQVQMMLVKAEDRLAQFMNERHRSGSNWQVLDTLPLLKQSELAQLLAISPEHLSRLLHREAGKPRKARTRHTPPPHNEPRDPRQVACVF